MWDERISGVRTFADAITERDFEATLELCHPEIEFFWLMAQVEASRCRGFAGIRRYFKAHRRDVGGMASPGRAALCAPGGCLVIVMSPHMRDMGSGLPFAQRAATYGSSGTRSSGARRSMENARLTGLNLGRGWIPPPQPRRGTSEACSRLPAAAMRMRSGGWSSLTSGSSRPTATGCWARSMTPRTFSRRPY
jgi:hypothetical protein